MKAQPQRVATVQEELAILSRFIQDEYARKPHLEILEAGCGRKWPFDLGGLSRRLTGLDADAIALRKRVEGEGDLAEAIHGDLLTAELPAHGFDLVYNSYVIEHIAGAEQVLKNFVRWLKPGGLMIIRFPDRDTVFGLLTRTTPHWVHIAYRRHLRGFVNAGRPGYGPYPTHYDRVVSLRGMQRFCDDNGLQVEAIICHNHDIDRIKPWARYPIKLMVLLIGLLSFGQLGWRHNSLCFVMRKPLDE